MYIPGLVLLRTYTDTDRYREWKPITGSLVITEDPYEMPHDGSFIRVCTVWLDTIKVLSLFGSHDDHYRNKLIKWWGKLEFADSEDHGLALDV